MFHLRWLSPLAIVLVALAFYARPAAFAQPEAAAPAEGWRQYHRAELGYSVPVPPAWVVDEFGLFLPEREVRIAPRDAEPSETFLSVRLADRPLDQITAAYAQAPGAAGQAVTFAGRPAWRYLTTGLRLETFVAQHGRVYLIITDRPDLPEVQQMLLGFTFSD